MRQAQRSLRATAIHRDDPRRCKSWIASHRRLLTRDGMFITKIADYSIAEYLVSFGRACKFHLVRKRLRGRAQTSKLGYGVGKRPPLEA